VSSAAARRSAAVSLDGLSQQKQDVLVALRLHRLLTSRQVWRLLMPHLAAPRPGQGVNSHVRHVLADLRQMGLADSVPSRLPAGVPAWFLTWLGWDVTQGMADGRTYQQTVTKALGASQLHTLGVNDVGLAFVEACRARGWTCGPLDWEHEVPHEVAMRQSSIGRRTPGPQIITSDALLRWEVNEGGQLRKVREVLVELDRSALVIRRVVEKVEAYHHLYRDGGAVDPQERWAGTFPPVLFVMEGRSHNLAATRLRSIVTAARKQSAYLAGLIEAEGRDLQPAVWFTTKDALVARGPFSPVWRLLADPAERRSLP
jgi:protein involved in plasmid replication-relaxation